MAMYQIIIDSKNQQALKFFFLFINKKKNLKFNLIKFYKNKKEKTKKMTILKSPHVNKIAQDQFEYKIISKQYNINSYNSSKELLFLKKLKTSLFSELKITIKLLCSKKESTIKQSELFNPIQFNFNNFFKQNNISQKLYKQITNDIKPCNISTNYLQTFDCYGELNLFKIKKCLDSSVGRAKD